MSGNIQLRQVQEQVLMVARVVLHMSEYQMELLASAEEQLLLQPLLGQPELTGAVLRFRRELGRLLPTEVASE